MNKLCKLFSAALLLAAAATAAQAQVERNVIHTVAIGDIGYTAKDEKATVGNVLGALATSLVTGKTSQQQPDYADGVRASIVKGLGNVTRLKVFNADDSGGGQPEAELKAEGTITNISTTTRTIPGDKAKDKKPYDEYNCLVNVTLNLTDARTNAVVDSRTFNISEGMGGWMSSAQKAITSSLSRLSAVITNYYNSLYPLSASIVERDQISKDKQKKVYIDLGSAMQAHKGQQFNIYYTRTIAGKEARMEIGRLKIEEVMGDELSLCKVTRGEKEVKDALDKGVRLLVTERF